MKLNLLSEKITIIQREYCELLEKLLPKLKDGYAVEALDEINIFWYRYIDTVQLYLKSIQDNEECYVFTAATYLDYDDHEHFPFLRDAPHFGQSPGQSSLQSSFCGKQSNSSSSIWSSMSSIPLVTEPSSFK